MSGSKYFDRIAAGVTALMLLLTVLFMNGEALGLEISERASGYAERLFDQSKVHTIDIVMDDWQDFIDDATSEEYSIANVVIDGEACKNVGIRAKGNTSLSTVANLGSERYSFKIEFDHYDKSKSYYGLDKLSLNNLIQDATMMKDYLTYTLMNAFGVDSSLCSYVYLTVNGEDWGLYLAVEGVEEAFLQRNYGADYGELYKPDSMDFGGGRGNGKDFRMDEFDFGDFDFDDFDFDFDGGTFDPSDLPEGMENMGNAGGMDFGGMGSSDVKLQYIDDDFDSYSNIWDNAKTDITSADKTRLIASLKKLSENQDIESVVDVEQVLRYFVVHNFVCNGDSYTGSMVHNYYLYEKDGKLSMLPWDYNLAFGTFQQSDANSVVNTPIDAPVSGGTDEDRPMWNWIVANEEYTQKYHQYFAEFLENIDIDGLIESAHALIADYVAKDPTAFYTAEEFETGVQTLRRFCALRSESIAEQLANGETLEDMGYADASDLTLSDMGSMGASMGGTMPEMPGNFGKFPQGDENGQDTGAKLTQTAESGESPEMPSGGFGGDMGTPPNGFGDGTGTPPDGFGDGTGTPPDGFGDGSGTPQDGIGDAAQCPDAMPGGNTPAPGAASTPNANWSTWIYLGASLLILAIGLVVAKKFKA